MDKISLKSIVDIVRNRKAPIAAVTLAAAVVTFVYFYTFAPKRYAATASALFSSKPSIGGMFNVQSLGDFVSNSMMQGADLNFQAILNSGRIQSNVFKRPEIIAAYKKIPRYKAVPEARIVDDEREFLTVTVENKVLYIAFLGPTPQIAADVANAYMDELVAFINLEKRSINQDQRKFMENELADSKSKLEEIEEIIRASEERNPELLNPDADTELVRRYSTLNMQKEQLLIELSSMETRNSEGNNVYAWASAANQVTDTMKNDPTITYLRQQLSQYNLELADKSQMLDDRHPTIVKLREQIAGTRAEIEAEVRKQYKGKQEYLDSIHSVLNNYDADIKAYPGIKMQYSRLFRDKEILTQVYELLRSEYEKLRIEEQRRDYSLTTLDTAVPPKKKSSPSTVKNTAAVAAAAFFAACYLFLLIDTRRAVRAGGALDLKSGAS